MNPILIIIGVGITIFGYVSLKKSQNLAKNGVKTMAKVIEITERWESDSDGHQSKMYYPLLEFNDESGKKHSFQGNIGSNRKKKYQLEQQIEILYDPNEPQKAQLKNFGTMWLMPLILMAVGAMLIFGGFVGSF
jgi:hypothetical protein